MRQPAFRNYWCPVWAWLPRLCESPFAECCELRSTLRIRRVWQQRGHFGDFIVWKLVEEICAAHFLHRQALKAVNCAFRWLWSLSVSRYRVRIYSEWSRWPLTCIFEGIINKFVGSFENEEKKSVTWSCECQSVVVAQTKKKQNYLCMCVFFSQIYMISVVGSEWWILFELAETTKF